MSAARLRSRLPALVARDLARRTLAVPDDLPLAEAVRRAQEAEAGSIVDRHQRRATRSGVVNEAALLATPEDRRPWVRRVDGRPHRSRTACGCRPTSRARS